LLLGIFGYLASPLWLLLLLTFNWALWFRRNSELSNITVQPFTPWLSGMSGTAHALLIFTICMSALFLPKILALLDLAMDRERSRGFGGIGRAVLSAVGETGF